MTTKKPEVKQRGKKELAKILSKTKIYKKSKELNICANCGQHEFDHTRGKNLCPPVFVAEKVTGLPVKKSRFSKKDFNFNKFPSQTKNKPTAPPYEIEGEPVLNCNKWTAMCVVLVLLCVVAYAMHGDYQALQSNLIH